MILRGEGGVGAWLNWAWLWLKMGLAIWREIGAWIADCRLCGEIGLRLKGWGSSGVGGESSEDKRSMDCD